MQNQSAEVKEAKAKDRHRLTLDNLIF